jgi:CPA2 family monovalent cation:H+ antiporter-2
MLLQLGLIITLALVGAALAKKLGHSMMIAYVLVGVLVGPFSPLPWRLITVEELESGPVYLLAKLGVIFIMFFVGLEFSIAKLRSMGGKAAVLAATDLSASLFVGFSVCVYFGYGVIDAFFVACIVAMSSTAVTMKVMEELGWQGERAADALIGLMVVEDVVSIILLTLANSLVFEGGTERPPLVSVAFVIVLMAFYLVLIIVFVPNVLGHIQRIKHEELFVLMAISAVILSASLAESFGLSAFIGAFFIGMAFAETELADRLKEKTVGFRDTFAAIFFVSFGMMIDPSGLDEALPMLAVLIPLVLMVEVLAVSSVAYVMGYGAREAVLIGGGTTSRSEDAIVFASVGVGLRKADGRPVLSDGLRATIYPMTGAFCLAMSSVTPVLVRKSAGLADWLSRAIPSWLGFSGRALASAVSRLMADGPESARRRHDVGYAMGAALAFAVLLVGLGPTLSRADDSSPAVVLVARVALAAGAVALAMMMHARVASALRETDPRCGAIPCPDGVAPAAADRFAATSVAVFYSGAVFVIFASEFSLMWSAAAALCFAASVLAMAWFFARRSVRHLS